MEQALEELSAVMRSALEELGITRLTPPQEAAIPAIRQGENVLLIAPTGSGKTEAALIPILDKYIGQKRRRGISILYITPLRALNRDMLRRLTWWAERLKLDVEIRHGDTSSYLRRVQARYPPDLLITTPETLQAMLPSKRMGRHLRHVRWVIVDEVHSLAVSKRGIQPSIGLQRLRRGAGDFQVIGLSATVGSPRKVGRLLVGEGNIRVIKCKPQKPFEFRIVYPEVTSRDRGDAFGLAVRPESAARLKYIRKLIDSHERVLTFVNCREYAEMLGSRLKVLAERDDIGVHHSSLSRESRTEIESDFKSGKLRGIVCTSSLELGIDIGEVDLVIHYLSPRRVTALIQRTGRSGHLLTRVSKGIIVCGHPDDVLESFVLANMALQDELETVKIHEKALDVLAHQLAGLVLDEGEVKAEEAFEVMRGAYPYRGLTHDEFERVARYLAELGYLAIADGRIRRVGMRTWRYYYEHLSMIPEELRFPVIDVETGDLIGSLGEDFYFLHAHEGLVFVCKGYPWKIVEMTGDGRVYVESVSDITGAIPGWEGRTLSVDFKVAMEVGKLRRRIASLVEEGRSIKELDERRVLDKGSTRLVTEYVRKQDDRGPVPSDRLVLIESDGRQVVVNCCFGHAVNLTLATVLRDIIRLRYGISSDVYRDAYRILIIPKEPLSAEDVKRALGEMTAERMRQFIVDNVDVYEMRHIALRFGAIPRSLVYKSPTNLPYLKYVYANTPIYDETLRETIMEFYDLENAIKVARMMREGEIEVRSVEGSISPMGRMILDRFKWLTEALTPETPKTLKEKIEGVTLDVLCFECGKTLAIDVGAAPNRLACECGSTTLLPLRWRSTEVLRAYRKWREGRRLGEDELKLFARAKMSGDLIRCYGKRGLVALLVRGIGPTTAARILARMHRTDDELFKDLLEAKRKYMETREYWD